MANRKKVSDTVRDAVLIEAGYKCANPTCRQILVVDIHHIQEVREGGGNDPDNLLALCPTCHALIHREGINRRAVRAWKGLLVSLNNVNRASADVLLTLAKEEKRFADESDGEEDPALKFRFTGDSLGFLAGLMTSGLADISRRYFGATAFGGSMPSFEVSLTDKGRLLVDAWKDGDPEALERMLSVHVSDGVKLSDSVEATIIRDGKEV